MLTRIKASVEKIMVVWKCGDSEKNRGDGWEVYESVWKCGDGCMKVYESVVMVEKNQS